MRLGVECFGEARSGEVGYGRVRYGMVFRGRHETGIEEAFRAALERRGLRKGIDFSTQYPLRHSFVLDFAFPECKVAVEVNGFPWHSTPEARKRDGFKNKILKRLGWRLFRFSDVQIRDDVESCIDVVLRAVNGRR